MFSGLWSTQTTLCSECRCPFLRNDTAVSTVIVRIRSAERAKRNKLPDDFRIEMLIKWRDEKLRSDSSL